MKNAVLTWVDPTGPLTGVEVAMRVQNAPEFTVINTVAKGVQRLVVPDLVEGTYEFRAVALNGDKRSEDRTTSGTIEFATPGAVTDLAVSFE